MSVSLISFFVVAVLVHIGSLFVTLTYKTVSDFICIRHFRNERKKKLMRNKCDDDDEVICGTVTGTNIFFY